MTSLTEIPICSKEELLLSSLLKWFSNQNNFSIFLPIVSGKTTISLRILDWFATNYSKKHNTFIKKDIFLDYKNQLKGFSKKQFDPFCRRKRIFLKYEKENGVYKFEIEQVENLEDYEERDDGILTTVGQLNFFKWCIRENIIEYVFNNIKDIEKDMIETVNKRNKKDNKLTSFKKGAGKRQMKVIIDFN